MGYRLSRSWRWRELAIRCAELCGAGFLDVWLDFWGRRHAYYGSANHGQRWPGMQASSSSILEVVPSSPTISRALSGSDRVEMQCAVLPALVYVLIGAVLGAPAWVGAVGLHR